MSEARTKFTLKTEGFPELNNISAEAVLLQLSCKSYPSNKTPTGGQLCLSEARTKFTLKTEGFPELNKIAYATSWGLNFSYVIFDSRAVRLDLDASREACVKIINL